MATPRSISDLDPIRSRRAPPQGVVEPSAAQDVPRVGRAARGVPTATAAQGDRVNAETWIDLLQRRTADQPDAVAFRYLDDGENESEILTYAALERRARSIGAALAEVGARGERVLLLHPPGLEFVTAFLGCLYAGAVAVPAYPPDPARLERTLPRLRAIVADAGARFVLTTSLVRGLSGALSGLAPEFDAMTWLATDALPDGASGWRRPPVDGRTLAFLQYTSGSTGTPKGVMLSHHHLLHNASCIRRAAGTEGLVVVGWLPLYHDMGLIGHVLQPLYMGGSSTLFSPADFLRRPARWLEAISRYGATHSAAPNFAYDLCVAKVRPEERGALDLSRWRAALVGAEPVRVETLERFAEAFRGCGFRRTSLFPCYGLAEATLLVSGGRFGVDARPERSGAADDAPRTPVSCGPVAPEVEVVIADPQLGTRCPDGREGEIWVGGPSVGGGYWGRPEASAETFGARLSDARGPFLRTGDLGFVRDGELFVTGRIKDLILLRGQNHYPQDVERTVERSHAAVRPGGSAAFSIEAEREERLVVVAEVRAERSAAELDAVIEAIRSAVAADHEIAVERVVLLAPGGIPKTSSGKIQRRASRAELLAGSFRPLRTWQREWTAGSAPGRWDEGDPVARSEAALRFVRRQIAEVSGGSEDRIEADAPLSSLNLDSLTTVELRQRLEDGFGVHLRGALARDTRVEALAEFLLDRHLATTIQAAREGDDVEMGVL